MPEQKYKIQRISALYIEIYKRHTLSYRLLQAYYIMFA